jgi:hypothetical protein
MPRLKLIVLSLLAALSASALMSVSASAAEAETRYYVEGAELKAAETYDAAVGPILINTEISSAKILIECDNNTVNGAIEPEGKQSMNLDFGDCTAFEINKGEKGILPCLAVQTRTERFVERSFWLFWTRQRLAEIKITERLAAKSGKTCLLAGEYEITGSDTGSLEPEGTIEKTEHEIAFTSEGSELKFAEQPVGLTFNVTRMKLLSGKKWRMG